MNTWIQKFVKTHTSEQVFKGFVTMRVKKLSARKMSIMKRLKYLKRNESNKRMILRASNRLQKTNNKLIQLKKESPKKILDLYVTKRMSQINKRINKKKKHVKLNQKSEKKGLTTIQIIEMFFRKAIFSFSN